MREREEEEEEERNVKRSLSFLLSLSLSLSLTIAVSRSDFSVFHIRILIAVLQLRHQKSQREMRKQTTDFSSPFSSLFFLPFCLTLLYYGITQRPL
jgi:hypothetical protein